MLTRDPRTPPWRQFGSPDLDPPASMATPQPTRQLSGDEDGTNCILLSALRIEVVAKISWSILPQYTKSNHGLGLHILADAAMIQSQLESDGSEVTDIPTLVKDSHELNDSAGKVIFCVPERSFYRFLGRGRGARARYADDRKSGWATGTPRVQSPASVRRTWRRGSVGRVAARRRCYRAAVEKTFLCFTRGGLAQ